MRYLIKFTKGDDIKFISHLDLMRTIQRVIRRSGIKIEYSKGFNPHMALGIAQPLSVGVSSEGDYLDIYLEEDMKEIDVKNILNKNTVNGIEFLEVSKSPVIENVKRLPQAMALIDAASYTMKIKYDNTENLLENLDNLFKQNEITVLKKSKKGEKMVDIKPMIKDIKYWVKDNELIVNTLISCGSRENLSADLLATLIKDNTKNYKENTFTYIKRTEMYAYKGKKLVPLYKYI